MPKLYVVATPIGNLSELSPRAADTLREADLILAEDTRVTHKLLAHIGARVPMQAHHRHNEHEQSEALVRRMIEEELTVALVSDAGTPGISDPGAALVRAAAAAGIDVQPIAGPSAAAAALSICGFMGAEYAFLGFPPRQAGDRERFLQKAATLGIPIIIVYESPHRVTALVESIARTLPQAVLCVCCDLTKRHELTLRGAPEAVGEALRANPNTAKGEYVAVLDVSACQREAPARVTVSAEALLLDALLGGVSMQEAIASAMSSGVSRNDAYRASIAIKKLELPLFVK